MLVARDNVRLERHTARDRLLHHRGVARRHGFGMLHEPEEEIVPFDGGGLCDLAAPARPFARVKRIERVRGRAHVERLAERADKVFARIKVDARFAAHRRVHHRQERRRDLDERHTAHVRRRDKPGEIADHAASERDHERVPA